MAGRKSTYTPERAQQIISYLQGSATIKDACAMVGISQDSYERWCKANADFAEAAMRARSQGRINAVLIIRKAIQEGSTEDARWLLERSDPESWGRRTYTRIEGLDELLALAKAKGVDASDLFAAMIAELASIDANG